MTTTVRWSEELEVKRRHWHDRLQDFQLRLSSQDPAAVLSYLYHYSSTSGIKNILKTGELWLFDVRTMRNDSRDGTRWVDVFRSVLESRESVPDWLKARFAPGRDWGMGKDWFNFATCLSPESGLLDQWQAFADQGKGCAIELAFPTIVEACNGGKEYAWTQMLYDSAEQRDRAERMVDVAIEVFRTEDVITEGEAIVYWTEAAFSFLCGGTRFKTSEFKNQREWRILRSRGSESREINEFDSRRYIPWRLPKSAVTGVVLGPNCESADAEIAGLLSAAGYEASVRRASITWGVD